MSPKLNQTLQGLLIGNIITSVFQNRSTDLQVALGVLRDSKALLSHFNDYQVTCNYDEISDSKRQLLSQQQVTWLNRVYQMPNRLCPNISTVTFHPQMASHRLIRWQ